MASAMMRWLPSTWNGPWVMHTVRTSIAAALALAAARTIAMPEAYWAPITTLVVMQSTLGASWTISRKRLVGTVLGAVLGGILAVATEPNIAIFGLGVFALGLACALIKEDQSAFRFASITLAISYLTPRSEPLTLIGVHRFVEVSIGIAVGLVVSAIWPGQASQPGSSRP